MADLGVRLQLLAGPTLPLPVTYAVVDALEDLEVRNRDRERDTFRMTFSVGKTPGADYALLQAGTFDPPARVSIVVTINGSPQVLIDGMATDVQLAPTDRAGESK